MNAYEAKLERRKERLEARADRLRSEGKSLYDRAHKMAEAIPFGQPILVGHHSEKRDRNYRGRIHSTFGKAFSTLKEADEAAGRAASVGTGGISSDDPEAVTKLKVELAEREAKQAHMTAVNKLVRKFKEPSSDAIKAFIEIGVPQVPAIQFMTGTKWERGYQAYQLSNNNANIRRIKDRIEQLSKYAERETKEVLHNSGVRMVENAEENRVQLFFPGKPAAEVRTMLKSHGFRWSPMAGAWQRHLNGNGVWAAKSILEKLIGVTP
jgi:hypothetical protein